VWFHYFHECIERLRAECDRRGLVIEKVLRESEWSLASHDPHDWKKGLEIIKAKAEGEARLTR
jgi:hypothetical protein